MSTSPLRRIGLLDVLYSTSSKISRWREHAGAGAAGEQTKASARCHTQHHFEQVDRAGACADWRQAGKYIYLTITTQMTQLSMAYVPLSSINPQREYLLASRIEKVLCPACGRTSAFFTRQGIHKCQTLSSAEAFLTFFP